MLSNDDGILTYFVGCAMSEAPKLRVYHKEPERAIWD